MKSILVFLLPVTVWAQNISQEVAEISRLRQEVELLSQDVEGQKKSQQSEMDVYIQRLQEVEGLILKEKFRQDQIKTQLKLGQSKLAEHTRRSLSKTSNVWLKEFWLKYEQSLQKAHPLYGQKLNERLDKLKLDLNFKKISYDHALLQTWFILEADLQKSQDTEFILAPLQIQDKLYHVEMVRLGRNKGYLRTAEGQYGVLSHNKEWTITFFGDPSSQRSIETLLGQFKQQQKTGLYTLPGAKL